MSKFTLHTIESAPEAAKDLLRNSEKSMGMIPNLHAVMATSPALLNAYQQLHERFTNSSFNAEEMTVVWQTINVFHDCHYCVPAHIAIAKSMGVDDDITASIKAGNELDDDKLEALRQFVLSMLKQRGNVADDVLESFYSAGFSQQHVLDVIVGIAQKTMSNYTNHIAHTPIDEPFKKFA
ncbi:carboxymuconolactone decarboxylase family protein [Pseudidiomarina sp.]|uniref:carboxymuconolactone decarboxylase family protein n=1 Tax=Pseudidiomarina sp. TaxID=2081707 RepID=UPI003A98736F